MHSVGKMRIQNSNREVQKEELPYGRRTLKLVFKTDSRDLDWIPLVLGQDKVRWRTVVKIVMTLDTRKRRGISWWTGRTDSQEGI